MTRNAIADAAAALRRGELVIFPTETVYGLGANALSAEAIQRIYALKGRPATNPLIVHVADADAARRWCSDWPEAAERLARAFWPGPLSLVLPKAAGIVDEATAGLPTVGLRVPSHPLAQALLKEAGVPVAAPSANPFTRLSPTRVEHVRREYAGRVTWILDGGQSAVGLESTVVSLAGPRPTLLRPGMISRRQLEEVVGPLGVAEPPKSGEAHHAPGQHAAHYRPRTRLFLFETGAPVGLGGRGHALTITIGARPGSGTGPTPDVTVMPSDPAAYAETLYAVLHNLDEQGYDWIAVEWPPESASWEAIRDRLRRAAG